MANDDPDIARIAQCRRCQAPMAALRVYDGTKDGHQHLRGRIAQTCTDYSCHWTHFHTEVSYLADDGEALIQRIRAREIGVPIPDLFLNKPLRVITPLPAPNGPLDCRANCQTSTGNRVRGSQACIELKCRKCCTDTFHTARKNNTPRDPCKAHKLLAVQEKPKTPPPVPQTQSAGPGLSISSPGRPLSPSHTASPIQHHVNASVGDVRPLGDTFPSPTVSLCLNPPPSSQNPASRNVGQVAQATTGGSSDNPKGKGKEKGNTRALAMPLGPRWRESKAQANLDNEKAEDLKIRRARIDEELKRTVEFSIYFKEVTAPLTVKLYIDTYPKLKLGSLPLLVKNLKLDEDSLFDFWDYPNWTTITPSSIILVEKDQTVILRHRPSVFEELSVEKCPGLSDVIAFRLRSRSKRAADTTLVSPLKKSSRRIDQASAGQATSTSGSSTQPPSKPDTPSDATALQVPAHQAHSISAEPHLSMKDVLVSTNTNHATPPNDSVSEPDSLAAISVSTWRSGYDRIDEMKDKDSKVTEASAFPTVFGIRYIKTTACKYKRHWKHAPKQLQNKFLKLGDTKEASLLNFTAALRAGSIINVASDDNSPIDLSSDTPPPLSPKHSVNPLPDVISMQSLAPFPNLPSPLLGHFDNIPPAVTVKNEPAEFDLDDSTKDFTKLCSFCDGPLPDQPSEMLLKMRRELEASTWLDPLPENPLHRAAASYTIWIHYCTRHEFELTQMPLATSAGWPMNPNFGEIFDRVSRDYLLLSGVAKHEDNEYLFSAREFYRPGPSRLQGSMSQMERSFEIGAGYYGEAGYQIIVTTIQHLFPRSSVNLIDIHPLTYDIFVREVLALEAAARLIQTDLEITRNEAMNVLKKSGPFGKIMHDSSSPNLEAHIQDAVRRARKSIQYDTSVFRSWIASGSDLSVSEWVKDQKRVEEEMRIKQEEMELDPLAASEEADLNISLKGACYEEPIDLTVD
ncbi:hypothetical protein GALMADRAFT_231366 [Galerina marginata CBS 339.88]|uniref:Restriction of telomere capping protein 4 n=1 Tax=Galerina marginata (strain CBS 339.88) TaxID=685588 RepID=A0A067SBV7_GALM3|nr:hypothetical protein GALMADRAFT_231366 [Galerina marginata CBS 339.88]